MNIGSCNMNKYMKSFLDFIYRYKYLITVIFVCGCYAGICCNQTMPFAEGWYTYYAQCINEGQVVYKDFDYLFTPLYIYLVAFITNIFGYKIIVLRFIGVVFFCLIGSFLFLTLREVFSEGKSMVATITAVFFLQSEIVQVFYDYVRLMEIFVYATTFFMVKALKNVDDDKKCNTMLFCTGVFNSLFFLTKQNMGILFFVYILILFFYVFIVLHKNIKYVLTKEAYVLSGFLVPSVLTFGFMAMNGSLNYYFQQTGADAIAAKGGVVAILFGWLKNNQMSFQNGSKFSIIILGILFASYWLTKNSMPKKAAKMSGKTHHVIWFGIICMMMFVIFAKNENIAKLFDGHQSLSPYSVFLIVFPIFVMMALNVLVKSVKGLEIYQLELLYISLAGSYFAISYGCGMSGGLSEGQATMGVAFTIALLLSVDFKQVTKAFKIIVIGICLLVTLQSAAKKMNYTYNWWGMDESNFWESTAVSTDIELLYGLGMSEETLGAYEEIYDVITSNTKETDPIYCFPQIPVFYSLCDRKDPGVRAKVQWFDVASDASIQHDMEVIQNNPPHAILIYETSEYAYSQHESSFRSGNVSATRKMKRFLLEYAQEHGYTFHGRITSTDNNSFLLYYKSDDDFSVRHSFEGEGTKESPYLINNAEDLAWLSDSVANGNDFSEIYFKQTSDIDLSGIKNWTPIGEFDSDFYFEGFYDGGGHVISNMQCTRKANVGLFGQLGGIVCNLGLVDCKVSGLFVGGIASHAVDGSAMIVNCYTDLSVKGVRAGGIADNFCGKIINCVSYSSCEGLEAAGAVSYKGGYTKNVYALFGNLHTEIIDAYGDDTVKYCTEKYIGSEEFLASLNGEVGNVNEHYDKAAEADEDDEMQEGYEEWMSKVRLNLWEMSKDNHPVLKISDN